MILFLCQGRQKLFKVTVASKESPMRKELGYKRRFQDLPFFDLRTVIAATDNFSATDKLGQGGLGSVYKVITMKP